MKLHVVMFACAKIFAKGKSRFQTYNMTDKRQERLMAQSIRLVLVPMGRLFFRWTLEDLADRNPDPGI